MNLFMMEKAFAKYREGASASDTARYDFFEGLFRLLAARGEKVACAFEGPLPDRDGLRALHWSGRSLLEGTPLQIDRGDFAQTCQQVAGHFVENASLEEGAANELAKFDWDAFCAKADLALAGRDPAAFLDACLADISSFGVSANLPASVFALVPYYALRAHLDAPAQQVAKAADMASDTSSHDHPLACPFCGSPSTAAVVGQVAGTDGKGRMLYCGQCGTTWAFERVRCAHCGERSSDKLHYFHLEGDSAHRLHLCNTCGSYERTVFQEDLAVPLSMEAEEVVMAKLDKVALDPRLRKEGKRVQQR